MLLIAGDTVAADLRTTNWKLSLETRTTEFVSAISFFSFFLMRGCWRWRWRWSSSSRSRARLGGGVTGRQFRFRFRFRVVVIDSNRGLLSYRYGTARIFPPERQSLDNGTRRKFCFHNPIIPMQYCILYCQKTPMSPDSSNKETPKEEIKGKKERKRRKGEKRKK